VALRGAAARRYAQAVFDIAKQSNSLDRWLADLATLNATFGERNVVTTLEDPNLNEDEQRQVIDGVLKPGAVSDLARNLLYILVRRQRLGLLPRIVEVFQEMYNKEKGIVVAEVTSAVPLDSAHRQRVADEISKITGGKTVDLHMHEDPRILGGIIARIGDELIDASIAARLADLSERLA
jgi:F-type H+-transporting ATPase subunit delta